MVRLREIVIDSQKNFKFSDEVLVYFARDALIYLNLSKL
jgi:hypothetical protein